MNPPVRDWFPSWAIWRLRGKPPPRPQTAPLVIPLLAWRLLGWVTWKLGLVKTKPLIVGNLNIQPWIWDALPTIRTAVFSHSPPGSVIVSTGRRYPSPTIMQRSIWIATLVNAPASYLHSFMQRAGYRLAFAQATEWYGSGPVKHWAANGLQSWASELQQLGGIPGGWSWTTTISDPAAEANAIVEAIRACNLAAFVVNGEKEAEQSGRSGHLILELRARLGPDFPLGWSPEPQLALAHEVFRANSIAYMQQAYPGPGGNGYDVAACMAVARTQGYEPRADCLPLVQAFGDDARPAADTFAKQAVAAGLCGVCVYPAEQSLSVAPEWWIACQP